MRSVARRFVIDQGNRFLVKWWNYKSFLAHNEWGYATSEEVLIASHAIEMETVNAVKYIRSRVVDRDASLRVASVMRNMNDDILTIRMSLIALGFDVTLFLPKAKSDDVLRSILRGSGVDASCISLTELALILATCKNDGKVVEDAMRVSAMGLGLLRYGTEVERLIQKTFIFESKVVGALIDSAYKDGEDKADEFASGITSGMIESQLWFENTMEMMYGVCLN